jgi:hypothetical protein
VIGICFWGLRDDPAMARAATPAERLGQPEPDGRALGRGVPGLRARPR